MQIRGTVCNNLQCAYCNASNKCLSSIKRPPYTLKNYINALPLINAPLKGAFIQKPWGHVYVAMSVQKNTGKSMKFPKKCGKNPAFRVKFPKKRRKNPAFRFLFYRNRHFAS